MKLQQLLTDKVKDNIRIAVQENRIHWINKGNKTIGFHTWEEHNGKILINNLWIEEKYRNKDNLLNLRKLFRTIYPKTKFYWKSRKRKRMVEYA